MNTTKIEEFVNKLAETGTTMLDNAPTYIHEYLSYCFVMQIAWILWALFLIIAPFLFSRFFKKPEDSDYYDGLFLGREMDETIAVLAYTFSAIIWFSAVYIIVSSIFDMIAIKYYPSAYLIQEILGHKCK